MTFRNDSANLVRTLNLLVYVWPISFHTSVTWVLVSCIPIQRVIVVRRTFFNIATLTYWYGDIKIINVFGKVFLLFVWFCWGISNFGCTLFYQMCSKFSIFAIHQYLVLIPLGDGIVLFGCGCDFWVSLLSPLYTKPISCIQISLCLMFCIKVSSSSIKKPINYHLLSQGSAQYLQT